MSDDTTTLAELGRQALAFRDERDWAQFHKLKDLVLALGIEAGELAELVLWKSDEQVLESLEGDAFRERMSEEIADVLIYLLFIAEGADIDLSRAVADKLVKNARKYPVERSAGLAKKYTELDDETSP